MSLPTTGQTAPPRATRREWVGLALLVLPMLMTATDITVMFFALPTISAALDPTATQALWIVHAYGFLIAGLLVTMGRLGDRVGPRRLLLIGSAAFAVLSVVAAFAPTAEVLIAARALMGVAGATLMPSLFSLLRLMFRDDGQRRVAIAVLFSTFSVGGAIGPLLGGVLLELFWWGSVFLINVGPMLLLLALGPALLPERPTGEPARLDLPSVLLSMAGMLAVVYGLQELAAGQEEASGGDGSHLVLVAGGVAVLALFTRRQRRLRDPLLDLDLLTHRVAATALAALLVVAVATVGIFYLFTQHLQWVEGLTPLRAGLWTLPYVLLNIAGALVAPGVAARTGSASAIALGLGLATVGAGTAALAPTLGAPLPVLVGLLALIGFGQGGAMALISDLIISGAPEEQAGSAAATQEVAGELGAALGIAAGGALGVLAYRLSLTGRLPDGVPEATAREARSSIHDGVAAAQGSPELLAAVREATTHGFQAFAGLGTGLMLASALLVAGVLVRGRGADSAVP